MWHSYNVQVADSAFQQEPVTCDCQIIATSLTMSIIINGFITNTAYWPEFNKSLEHCHSGRFKNDNVGTNNANVPACTIGNLQ